MFELGSNPYYSINNIINNCSAKFLNFVKIEDTALTTVL